MLEIPRILRPHSEPQARGGLRQSLGWWGASVLAAHRTRIVELAAKSRLPVIYNGRESVEAGGLMSYGVNINDLDRRAALYVDKILKGSEASRSPGGAADEVRVHHQLESREADWPDDPAECAGESGQGDQIGTNYNYKEEHGPC